MLLDAVLCIALGLGVARAFRSGEKLAAFLAMVALVGAIASIAGSLSAGAVSPIAVLMVSPFLLQTVVVGCTAAAVAVVYWRRRDESVRAREARASVRDGLGQFLLVVSLAGIRWVLMLMGLSLTTSP